VGLARLVLLLLAAAAAASGLILGRRHDHPAIGSAVRFVCPMHPEVASGAPADCPICGMALQRAGRNTPPAGDDPLPATELFSAREQPASAPRYSTDIVRHRVLRQELDAPAWVQSRQVVAALLYRDELPSLTPEEPAAFFPADAPPEGVAVRAAAEAPSPWDRSTSVVRFRVEDPVALRAGAAGWLKLARKPRQILVVPSAAVLQSAEGPYVLVMSTDGQSYGRRLIEVGKVLSGFTAVVSGVQAGQQVVSINAFFVDAERRLRTERRSGGGRP
jgi:hypothetical protein